MYTAQSMFFFISSLERSRPHLTLIFLGDKPPRLLDIKFKDQFIGFPGGGAPGLENHSEKNNGRKSKKNDKYSKM